MKDLVAPIDTQLAQKFKEASKKKVDINDFVKEFINNFLSSQTQRAYLRDLKDFFSFLSSADLQIRHPKEIEGHHFRFYRDKLIEENLTSATINRKLVAIRSFIKWSMAQKLIDYNPLDVIKLPKVQTAKPTLAFEDHEVLSMIEAIDQKDKKAELHRLVLGLLFSLGLRRNELVNIKLKHIYHERGHTVLEIQGKGNKTRLLPLHENLVSLIDNYIHTCKAFGIDLGADDYLLQSDFKDKNVKAMNGSTVYRIVQKYAAKCQINKRVSPHSCRATAISHLLDTQKTPIRDVAIFAGHSQITTTQRYDKRIDSLNNSAAYAVDYQKKKSS